jgi:predicted phosphodiesterase
MRVAFLADIHGNLPALEAVLKELKDHPVDAVYTVGDMINRLPWTNEVLDLIQSERWQAIVGNHEAVIGSLGTAGCSPLFNDQKRFADLWWTQRQLAVENLAYVRTLPLQLRIEIAGAPPIRLFHGVPDNPFVGIFKDSPEQYLYEQLAQVEEEWVVCGHIHSSLDRQVGTWRIVNGGSVGMPYNRDPRAQYLVLELKGRQWQPAFRKVEYAVDLVREAFITSSLAQACGELAQLFLLTTMSGEPWISDFGYWRKSQPPSLQTDMARAVATYREQHGPGRWSFATVAESESGRREHLGESDR